MNVANMMDKGTLSMGRRCEATTGNREKMFVAVHYTVAENKLVWKKKDDRRRTSWTIKYYRNLMGRNKKTKMQNIECCTP